MRKPLLLLLFLLQAFFSWAQKPLTNSRKSSVYTYIYRLDDESTLLFLKGKQKEIKNEVLKDQVAKYLTDRPESVTLAPGNYLKVVAVGNELQYRLIQKHTALLLLFENGLDTRFILTDNYNNEINDAQVSAGAGNKQILYDTQAQTYHTKRSAADTIIKVVYKGVSNFFAITDHPYVTYRYPAKVIKSSFLSRVWKKIMLPFHNLFKTEPYTGKTNPGFVVFNKPKYRPGDTVKLKAFILQRKSKLPVEDQKLIIRLKRYEGEPGKIIGYTNSYRKGGFDYQFKLKDSLEIRLDNDYLISLEPFPKKTPAADKKYPYPSYQLNPDVYIQGKFRYEDYELKTTRFNMRVDREDPSPGLPMAMYFKAIDENGLSVPDGRVNITLVASWVNDYNNTTVFVPDTLWQHQLQLDAVGETKLVLPDSIFRNTHINFMAHVTFLNSNNESQKIDRSLTWNYRDRILDAKIEQDSLKINYLTTGKSLPAKGWLSQINATGDTISNTAINLPAVMPVNHAISAYIIKVADLDKRIYSNMSQGNISMAGNRTADSLFIRVNNPLHLKFWYTMFAGNKIVEQGAATELNYGKPFKHSGAAYILINYVWGGMPQYNKQAIPYQDKNLDINVKQPISVYPGQQATVEVDVKDNNGRAVAGADITAYSFTRKFEKYEPPQLPYLGKGYPYKPLNPFLVNKRLSVDGELKLNWQYWSKSMGLDSIKYYQFTHTESTFQVAESVADSITQVAPFVVKSGDIIPVHILYIDEEPVYFSQSQDMQHYSFIVSPGKHNFAFRTTNQWIVLDAVEVPKGKKLILSVSADSTVNIHVPITARPDTLQDYEAGLINKYMISVVHNFGWHPATLQQDDKTFLINYNSYNVYNSNNYYRQGQPGILVGPFFNKLVDFQVKDGLSREFTREGGYSFEFQPDLIKQKSLPTQYPFNRKLKSLYTAIKLDQDALTPAGVDTLWQNYLDENQQSSFYSRNATYSYTGAKLIVGAQRLKNGSYPYIKSILIFKNSDPNAMEIIPGRNADLGRWAPGRYRVFYLFKGDSYYLQENVVVRPGGINYYSTGIIDPHAPDSVSIKIAKLIKAKILDPSKKDADELIKRAFNDKYMDMSVLDGQVTGKIFNAESKKPIKGAIVNIVNTSLKTITDAMGSFKIKVPKTGVLTFNYPGLVSERLDILQGDNVEVYLAKVDTGYVHTNLLKETVIRGYIKRSRDQTTGASYIITGSEVRDNPVANVEQLLQGKVAGLNIQNNSGAPGMRGAVNIRGLNEVRIGAYAEPLYIVDGIPTSKDAFSKLTTEDIVSMSVLKDDAAKAIYGDSGAAGVIIIITKKGVDLAGNAQTQVQNMRRNFSDYAYWQPRLTTDAEGKAKFTVTYPDDITNWRTFVIGITDNKQTGFTEGQVKAFKPLSANFVSPLFVVRGDSFKPLGKVMNYTADTLTLKRSFIYNNKTIADGNINIVNAHIDTFKLIADGKDSLTFEYAIKRSNGYFDGEKRMIPIMEQGSLETKGSFDVLERDTTINLQFNPALKEVTLTAEASLLPVLLDETEHLHTYEYLCNEQLASKLKGLLAEKHIRTYLGQKFKWDADINEIIKKLNDSRTKQGTWGWWKDTDEELWISYHVIEALLDAENNGFKTLINKQQLIDYLMYRLTIYNGHEKLTDVAMLKALGAKANLPGFVTAYEKSITAEYPPSDLDKITLMYTRQLVGMPIVIDSLLKTMRHTMFGNVYWGIPAYNFFNNAIPQSLLAYHILKGEGRHPQLLAKLRNYFMAMRRDGNWRNTYESAQILETILPDILVDGQKPKPAQLTITGDKMEIVTTFPYSVKLGAANKISIAKTGDMPVYLTTYQKFWNPEPAKVNGDFMVNTWFQKGVNKVTGIKGGEAITLYAEVTVKADADFVMIEIPIPAGCSYESKEQGYYFNEVHREYFKNKVSIFCRKLTVGKYTYTVKLMPRYTGNYHLNPAKAEMMYYPVFYGREGMKQFKID